MDFPRHLHQPEGRFVVVDREDVCQQLLSGGWTLQPSAHVERPVEVRLVEALSALNGAVIDFDEAHPPPEVIARPTRGRPRKLRHGG